MCEQCVTDAQFFLLKEDGSIDSYKNLLPGWALFQAAKDGCDMEKGEWGLVQCNNPDFIWSVDPIPNPYYELSAAEEKKASENPANKKQYKLFTDRVNEFAESLNTPYPVVAWRLVDSAKKMGFDPNANGLLRFWLFHRLGMWVKEHKPIHHGDGRIPESR